MLMRSIESSLLLGPTATTSHDDHTSGHGLTACPTDSESNMSDVDELSSEELTGVGPERVVGDWEHVPLSLPEVDVLLTSRTASPSSYFTESSQAATVTSIVSSAASAATSALSFWRGWGRSTDNR